MIRLEIPGRGSHDIANLVLDVNGTIACGGELLDSVAELVGALSTRLHVVAITADTHGTARELEQRTGVEVRVIERGNEDEQKLAFIQSLGAGSVAALGNGTNDARMLAEAAIGIAVIGCEGLSTAAMRSADVVTTSIESALMLLVEPNRLVATLRS